MKNTVLLLCLSGMSSLLIAAPAQTADDPCVKKRAEIVAQLNQARADGNRNRVAGLTKALQQQERHCSAAAIRTTREQEVAEARNKLAERDRELQEARAEGKDADKIARREAKAKEAQEELQRAQDALGN